MKNVLVLLWCTCFVLVSCAQNQLKIAFTPYQQQLFDNLDANSKNKHIKYAFFVKSRLPYRIFINGLFVGEHIVPIPERELNSNTSYDLDNYILGNGTYTAQVEFYPMGKEREEYHEDGLIHPEDFNDPDGYNNVEISLYRWEEKDGKKLNTSWKEYRFSIKEPVAYLKQEIEFTISDLPYQVKGWTESKDLREIEKEVLEKEVVAYYTYLRNLLDTGQKDTYNKLEITKDLEIATTVYFTKEEYYKMLKKSDDEVLTKGKMYPLENYRMAIEGDGRLVKLYRTDNEFLNWNVLLYNDDKYKNSIGVRLHKPKGSDTFEIITK